MKALVAAALMGASLAGCATSNTEAASEWPLRYTKAGITSEQLEADATDCHWTAKGPKWATGRRHGVAALTARRSAPTAATHAACMKEKGYTVNP